MKIATKHIQKLLKSAVEQAAWVDGREFETNPVVDQEDVRLAREALLTGVRQARHAVAELEAELHKVEYGYDIS